MIVVDRASSTGTYGYTNLFRFGSLIVNAVSPPYTDANYLGNVQGTLKVNGSLLTWLSLGERAESDVGASTNNIS